MTQFCVDTYKFDEDLCKKCNNFMDSDGNFINPNIDPKCENAFNVFCTNTKNIGHTGCQAISAQQQVPALQAQGITVTMTDDVSEAPTGSASGPSGSKPPCPVNDEHLCKCLEKNIKGESVFDDSTKQPPFRIKNCRTLLKENKDNHPAMNYLKCQFNILPDDQCNSSQMGSNVDPYRVLCTGNYNFSNDLCEKCDNFYDSDGNFINPNTNTNTQCKNDFDTFCNDPTNVNHIGCKQILESISVETLAAEYGSLQAQGITITMSDDVSEDPTSGPSGNPTSCPYGEHLCKCVEKNMNGESVSSVFGDLTKPPLPGSEEIGSCRKILKKILLQMIRK